MFLITKMKAKFIFTLFFALLLPSYVSLQNLCTNIVPTSTGWATQCGAYSIKYTANSEVTITCDSFTPSFSLSKLFASFDFQGSTSFRFIECPPPEMPFSEILNNYHVTKIEYQVSTNCVNLNSDIFRGLHEIESITIECTMMTSIPQEIFQDLESLLMVKLISNISVLPDGLFDSLELLTELNLIRNPLTSLQEGIFHKLSNLKTLVISNGFLTELPSGIFSRLCSLEELSLRNNYIKNILPAHLSNLINLRIFDMNTNNLNSVDANLFQKNLKLQSLDMGFNPTIKNQLPYNLLAHLDYLTEVSIRDCNFENIPDNLFQFAPNLQTIYMGANLLTSISSSLFSSNHHLKKIDMRYNNVINIAVDAFSNLSELQALNLNGNNMRTLPQGLFDNNTNLEHLDLKNCFLDYFPENLFNKLVNLKSLNLGNNCFRALLGSTPFGLSSKLEYIDVSYNNMKTLPVINWNVYTSLKMLDLKRNLLINISLPALPSWKAQVILRYNLIETVFLDELGRQDVVISPNVKQARLYFDLNYNSFVCDCRMLKFAEFINMTKYSLEYRKYDISFLSDSSYTCSEPSNLKNQKLLTIPKHDFVCNWKFLCPLSCYCYFRAVDSVVVANCSNQGLSFLPRILPPNTTELYFSNNQLKSLSGLQFLDKLRVLDVSHNQIESSDCNLPQNLTELHLNDNQMLWIPSSVLDLASKPESKVYLGGNPYFCDCVFKKLKSTVLPYYSGLKDAVSVVCESNSKGDVLDTNCPEDTV